MHGRSKKQKPPLSCAYAQLYVVGVKKKIKEKP